MKITLTIEGIELPAFADISHVTITPEGEGKYTATVYIAVKYSEDGEVIKRDSLTLSALKEDELSIEYFENVIIKHFE